MIKLAGHTLKEMSLEEVCKAVLKLEKDIVEGIVVNISLGSDGVWSAVVAVEPHSMGELNYSADIYVLNEEVDGNV